MDGDANSSGSSPRRSPTDEEGTDVARERKATWNWIDDVVQSRKKEGGSNFFMYLDREGEKRVMDTMNPILGYFSFPTPGQYSNGYPQGEHIVILRCPIGTQRGERESSLDDADGSYFPVQFPAAVESMLKDIPLKLDECEFVFVASDISSMMKKPHRPAYGSSRYPSSYSSNPSSGSGSSSIYSSSRWMGYSGHSSTYDSHSRDSQFGSSTSQQDDESFSVSFNLVHHSWLFQDLPWSFDGRMRIPSGDAAVTLVPTIMPHFVDSGYQRKSASALSDSSLPHAIVQDGSSSSCLQFHRFTAQGCFVHGGGFGSIALSPNNFRFKIMKTNRKPTGDGRFSSSSTASGDVSREIEKTETSEFNEVVTNLQAPSLQLVPDSVSETQSLDPADMTLCSLAESSSTSSAPDASICSFWTISYSRQSISRKAHAVITLQWLFLDRCPQFEEYCTSKEKLCDLLQGIQQPIGDRNFPFVEELRRVFRFE